MATSFSRPATTQDSLLRRGAIALFGSVIANLVVWAILETVLDIPADFMPLDAFPIALFTALGAIAATIVYWIVRRISATPDHTFTIIAIVVLVLSIVPNVIMAVTPEGSPFPFPVTATGMLALIIFHIVAALVDIWALTD